MACTHQNISFIILLYSNTPRPGRPSKRDFKVKLNESENGSRISFAEEGTTSARKLDWKVCGACLRDYNYDQAPREELGGHPHRIADLDGL